MKPLCPQFKGSPIDHWRCREWVRPVPDFYGGKVATMQFEAYCALGLDCETEGGRENEIQKEADA